MAEVAEKPFLQKLMDSFKGIPLDELSRPPIGNPSNSVPPTQAAPPAQAAPENPVVTNPVASQPEMNPIRLDPLDEAKQTGNAQQARLVAANSKDPDEIKVANHVANRLDAGKAEYEKVIGPIERKGGLNTRDGRLELAKTFQNRDNQPQYFNALVQFAMGNKKAAMSYITGGQVKDYTMIDNATDDAIKYGMDELGDYHHAINLTTGKQLTQDEFNAIANRLTTYEKTSHYLAKSKVDPENAAKANAALERANYAASAAPSHLSMLEERDQILTQLKDSDFPPEVKAKLAQFSTTSLGKNASARQALETLKQRMSTGSLKQGDEIGAALAGALGIAPGRVQADGSIKSSDGKSWSLQDLDQRNNSGAVNSEIEKNFTQTKADFENYARQMSLAKMPDGAEKLLMFNRYMDLTKTIAQKEAELPFMPFNLPTTGGGVTDEFARARIQGQQGIFSQKANIAYQEYAKDKAAVYKKTGTIPSPGEFEAGFIGSDQYKKLLNEYKTKANQILKEPRTFNKEATEGILQAGGSPTEPVVPPALGNVPVNTQYPTSTEAPKGSAPPAAKPGSATVLPTPKEGDIRTHEGKQYKFKGGDPNKKSNWTEVK